MALVELKFEDTVIYVEDEVPVEETGIALNMPETDDLENTMSMKPIKSEEDLLGDTMIKEKNRLFKFIFIYLIFTIILTTISFIYALLLHNGILFTTEPGFNNVTFIIGLILFFILGLLSGIVAKKNGLIEGLLSSLYWSRLYTSSPFTSRLTIL